MHSAKTFPVQLLLALLAVIYASAATSHASDACVVNLTEKVAGGNRGHSMHLASPARRTHIVVDSAVSDGVHRAVQSFAKDLETVVRGSRVLVRNATSINDAEIWQEEETVVLVGSLSKAGSIMEEALKASHTDVSSIQGQWESWAVNVACMPTGKAHCKDMLLVSGADMRGTTYALYTISEQIGMSPWHWFADVPPQKHSVIEVQSCWHPSPAVKYRGIFLNDEQPGLTSWANGHFQKGSSTDSKSPLQQSFLPDFYKQVFELLLRMKANMLWPAMWSDMFAVAGLEALPKDGTTGAGPNQVLADSFGIIYSTSHQEPMARNTPEWTNFGKGDWNYTTNRDFIQSFWRYGAQRAARYETLYTVGMRGNGDVPLPGANVKLLQNLVEDQRAILSEAHDGINVSSIPQFWCLYKEVQGYYDADGLQVPPDVTLLWTDDNWGNLRRVPLTNETARPGGSGLYYHFDYVGDPRNYKWVSTINFAKTYEQLNVAQQTGLDRIFILNVGDLKPIEVATHFALSLSYSGTRATGNGQTDVINTSQDWLVQWSRRTFPSLDPAKVAHVIAGYNALNNKIKPELVNSTTWSLALHREAERVMSDWKNITDTVADLARYVTQDSKVAFEQLVSFPALASSNLNELYVAVGKANLYASQARTSANIWAQTAQTHFLRDAELTRSYHSLLNGKWNGMMSQPHINYQYWQQPLTNTLPPVSNAQNYADSFSLDDTSSPFLTGPLRVTVEGSLGAWPGDNQNNCAQGYSCPPPTLAAIGRYDSWQSRYVDISSGTWQDSSFFITSNVSWLNLSETSGQLKGDGSADRRIWLTVDWTKVAPDSNDTIYAGMKITPTNNSASTFSPTIVTLPVQTLQLATLAQHKGAFIASKDFAAMHATNATSKSNNGGATWVSLPGYGMTGNAVTTFPPTHPSFALGQGPSLTFDFYMAPATLSTGQAEPTSQQWNVTTYLSPSLNYRAGTPMTFALQMDDGDPVQIQPVPLAATPGSDPKDWNDVVGAGMRVTTTGLDVTDPSKGWHSLKVWVIEPGLVLEMVAVGQVPPTTLPPPQSYRAIST